jgi:Zn-dependent peptidase ImmA (M78 family)
MLARVRARGDRALARMTVAPGATFDDVVRAVEHAVDIRLRVIAETDTATWGTLTGFLVFFPDRREGAIHVRASDAPVYREFAASHELGHLLDDAHCCGAVHERSSVSPQTNPDLDTAQVEAELVAEHVAHAIARLLYASPRIAELSW